MQFSTRNPIHLASISLALVFGALAQGCADDENQTPRLSTDNTQTSTASMVLSVSPSTTTADGVSTLTVEANVRDANGDPITDGTSVDFSIASGVGLFASVSDTTVSENTSGGNASVEILSTAAGAGSVMANAIGLTRQGTYEFFAPVTSGGGGGGSGGGGGGTTPSSDFSGTLILTATPTQTSAGLENEVTINGWAVDEGNVPAAAGQSVTFAIVSGPGANSGYWGIVDASADIGEGGAFDATYRAAILTGSVTIRAYLGSSTADLTVNIIDRSPASVVVTVDPNSLTADGISTADVSVSVQDSSGQAVADGTEVDLRVLGTGDAGSLDDTILQTSKGKINTVYTAGKTGQAVQVSASTANGAYGTAALTLLGPASVSVSIVPTTVEKQQSATVTATVLDAFGNGFANTDVTFALTPSTSDASLSTLNALTNEDGRAIIEFRAGDDAGIHTVTASVGTTSNSADVSVIPPDIGSIQFLDATPEEIGVKGSASAGNSSLKEVSVVRFQVLTASGSNVPDGTDVTFQLEAPFGTKLLSTSAKTVDGIAQTSVRSGTVAGLARVRAEVAFSATKTLLAYSESIPVIAGPPSDGNLSVAVEPTDLITPGMSVDGIEIDFTIRMADRYNNPVPDGTPVYFSTEAGQIDASARTVGGSASFILYTQDLRPIEVTDTNAAPTLQKLDFSTLFPSGRGVNRTHTWPKVALAWQNRMVDIVAIVQGEERFSDSSGNGTWDPGEPFIDVSEPFIDYNGNGTHDSSVTDYNDDINWSGGNVITEPYWDTITLDSMWNPGNGTYDAAATLHVHREVIWTDNTVPTLQYMPQQFLDRNYNGFWDPATDVVVMANGVTAASAATRCAVDNSVPATAIVHHDGATFGAGDPLIKSPYLYVWMGDSAGVWPYNGGTMTFSGGDWMSVFPVETEFKEGGDSFYPTGYFFELRLLSPDSFSPSNSINRVRIKLPDEREHFIEVCACAPDVGTPPEDQCNSTL